MALVIHRHCTWHLSYIDTSVRNVYRYSVSVSVSFEVGFGFRAQISMVLQLVVRTLEAGPV